METFLRILNQEFRKVCPRSYLEYNTAQTIVYPYVTYALSSEDLELQEGFYIDVDIFDNCGGNTLNLELLTHSIKKNFKGNKIFNNDMLIQFEYQTARTIPTGVEQLRRRNLQLYCKVDWRK